MTVIGLADLDPDRIDLVGGKAAGLGALIRAGERVPDGFCLTTAAEGRLPAEEVAAAYAALGDDVPVAVRSSATAEDLPWASFAGQQDTVLGVRGGPALLAAIETCWASLHTDRAVAYRRTQGIADAQMAVVVQRMVAPQAAGVLFTANPITGSRSEMVVDAAPGLGTAVVDGNVETDHYVLGHDQPADPGGCLDADQLSRLRAAGERVQRRFGSPQDIEWAFDTDGTLWLLQSRAITSLFPVPDPADDGPHVYMEAGHMQGMLRPLTPMGQSVLQDVTSRWFEAFGAKPGTGSTMVTYIGGRMYIDLTAFVRSASMRSRLPAMMAMYGPRTVRGMEWVCEQSQFAPRRGRPVAVGTVLRITARMLPTIVGGLINGIRSPEQSARRTLAAIDEVREACAEPEGLHTPEDRLDVAEDVHVRMLAGPMMESLSPLWAAMICQQVAAGLLEPIADESDVAAVMRGAPHNVTTQMDLALWQLADEAREHRDLLTGTPSEELARRYQEGTLPDIGLDEFLAAYGHRTAAEIDVGVPRWEEDPAPLFDVLAGYLQLTDTNQAPEVRFRRAGAEANAALGALMWRARRTGPVRAAIAGLLLRRARALIGLRELPKFLWLFALRQVRRQLLAVGATLADRGLLDSDADVMFLDLAEVRSAVGQGVDHRDQVRERTLTYHRELRRRQVPGLLLSDGTDVEAVLPRPESTDGLTGMGAAPGTATGRARVIRDPRGARIEPGEILVAPTTDPGWTPLFMTAAGLVTETGSPMAHGPTVAREYGIPAVICVRDATIEISTGDLITIDGAAGVVRIG
ncbi:PEP/pyruvate-binding domain-containing protein [Ruania alba]|uniref:Pyruvate, water dikinase n=1 Tax=Ruania alba TaxID=648782 RepID=A0A1H5NFZ7_9MICO|nr:PEP/pyruvate-binding domain-containing protein [Ruania alba]SEF00475.1 pyruvate, water dikinase [Ruania alba]